MQQVSVISTVYNEAHSVDAFLESIERQTRKPDEIVICDGGSSDETTAKVQRIAQEKGLPIRLISSGRVNIAEGRNQAIRHARHGIIACVDAGTVLHRQWLERIVAPFEESDSPDVVAGWFTSAARTPFEEAVGLALIAPLWKVNEANVSPSSRSLAMKKSLWQRVGGYPEHLTMWGEDTQFNLALRRSGARFAFRPDALVCWRHPTTLSGLFSQNFRYGFADGEARYFAPHFRLTGVLLAVALLLAVLAARWRFIVWPLVAAAIIYLELPLLSHRRLPSPSSLAVMPLVRLVILGAQWIGFIYGMLSRRR